MPDNQKYRTILMFGAPGSGKGTQGKVLGGLPGFYHLACGDIFRNLNPNSELGRVFLEHSIQGKLVPDHFTVDLWVDYIHRQVQAHHFSPNEEILVLDGIPRNRHQAEMMEPYIDVFLMICLEAEDEEALIARMRRRALHENRLDDANEEVIRRRFREYAAETASMLDYYPKERIRRVDAGGTPIQVLHGVVEAVQAVVAAKPS